MNNNNHVLPRAPAPRGHRMMHPWIPLPACAAIEAEAVRRGVHPDALVARLVDAIATDRLFGALLDR